MTFAIFGFQNVEDSQLRRLDPPTNESEAAS